MEDEERWVLPCWLKPSHTPSDLYLSGEGLLPYWAVAAARTPDLWNSALSTLISRSQHFFITEEDQFHIIQSQAQRRTGWVGRFCLMRLLAHVVVSLPVAALLFKAPFIPNNQFFRQHHHSCVQIVSGRSLQLTTFSSRRIVVYRQPSHGVALIRIMRSLASRSSRVQHVIISLFVWQADSH